MLAQLEYVNLRAAVLFNNDEDGQCRQQPSAAILDPARFWYTVAGAFLRP